MKFGLSVAQFEILDRLVVQPLKNMNALVYVFGSRARGTNHPFSDIDIMYLEAAGRPISSEVLSKIKESVEDSSLTIRVDLVNLNELAKSYVENADREKILV